MPAKEQRLDDWYWNNKYQSEKHGPGVREAFRAGARAAIRGRKEDPYSRNDCYDAYNAGYFAMKETLETTVIICDCCESHIDKRPGEYHELTQSEIDKLKKLPMLPLPGR